VSVSDLTDRTSGLKQVFIPKGACWLNQEPWWRDLRGHPFTDPTDIAWRCNDERTAALDSWLEHYNTARSHSALGGRPPISRLAV
jgi:transposase InsO family protein